MEEKFLLYYTRLLTLNGVYTVNINNDNNAYSNSSCNGILSLRTFKIFQMCPFFLLKMYNC